MSAEELKHKLKEIFGDEIVFNNEFDTLATTIKNISDNLISWCRMVKEGKIKYLPARKVDSIVFIKKIGSSNRCIIIKLVNGIYKEIHLANHKYYDKLRKEIGLKKDNKKY